MRHSLLPAALAVLALAAGCQSRDRSGASVSAPSHEGADVVLVTIDTLRADALGFAGNQRVETPVLDRLAAPLVKRGSREEPGPEACWEDWRTTLFEPRLGAYDR